jgi:hypothetical protein
MLTLLPQCTVLQELVEAHQLSLRRWMRSRGSSIRPSNVHFIASYVMKTNNLDFEAALALVKSKRSIVYPNTGFREQLNLYNQLKFTVNKESDEYKQFCAKLEIKRGKKPLTSRSKSDLTFQQRRFGTNGANSINHLPETIQLLQKCSELGIHS